MAEQYLPALLEANKERILGRFPKLNDWLTPEIWWSILQQMRGGKLENAAKENPDSVLGAMLQLADWGLKPDGDEAFINVYNEKQLVDGREAWVPTAQAQWMYKGGIRRAVEAGVIAHAVADIVREGDEIREFVDQKGRHLEHHRNIAKAGRKVIGSYALFWLANGLMDYELCDIDDIERAKQASLRNQRSKDPKLSPAWQFSYPEQAKKTAIRRGLKRMQGKRDKAFAAMMVETHYDQEIDGTEVPSGELTDDEQPRAEDSQHDPEHEAHVALSAGSQAAAHADVEVVLDEPAQGEAPVSTVSPDLDDTADASEAQKSEVLKAFRACTAKDKSARMKAVGFIALNQMTVGVARKVLAELEMMS